MDRKSFVEQFETAESTIDERWLIDTINKSIDSNLYDGNPRGHRNLIIVMEELAELTKELSKELRDKRDEIGLLEELADVQLGIYYVQEICGIPNSELNKAMNVKMKRLENIIDKKGKYK